MGAYSELFIQLREEIEQTTSNVQNGELSHLDGLLYLRGIKKELDSCGEKIKEFESNNIQKIAEEADQYGNNFKGFEIKEVSGRKTYSFKNITEILEKEEELKTIEEKYKSAFNGFQRGTVQTTLVDGELMWIDENGEIKPFPELNVGKSYISVKEKK